MSKIELLKPEKELKTSVQGRIVELKEAIKELRKAVNKAPQGALRVCRRGQGFQYYLRNGGADTNGKYLPKRLMNVAQGIVQREYNARVLQVLARELEALESYMAYTASGCVEKCFLGQQEGRRKLIEPVTLEDAVYAGRWLKKVHENSGDGMENWQDHLKFKTQNGEMVRSKSEVIIADALARNNVPYCYEYNLSLNGGRMYPDFLCLNLKNRKGIFWEHFGLMDNQEYAEKAVRKINLYIQNGYLPGDKLIFTMETSRSPLDLGQVEVLIEKYLI